MVRHSKNNTASGVFTYAERQMTDYGTKSKRLGKDSKQKYDSCYLCLRTARKPMICPRGHIICRECVMTSILEQKRAIERGNIKYKEYQRQEEKEQQQRQKLLEEKEIRRHNQREIGVYEQAKGTGEGETEVTGEKRPRMIEYHEDNIVQKDELPKASKVFALGDKRRPIDKTSSIGQDEEETKKLPSFWIPSLAPSAKPTIKPPVSQTPQCLASSVAHPLKLKTLVEVKFRIDADSGEKLCPSCDRALLNSSKIDVLRPCGHAICHRCVNTFVADAKECFVCQCKVTSDDFIRIDSEGTGFAGAGGQMVATRYGSALQA